MDPMSTVITFPHSKPRTSSIDLRKLTAIGDHPDHDRLMTILVRFLSKYSGTYLSREVLRTRFYFYLDNEYLDDLGWFNRRKDMEHLIDLLITTGGISVGR